MGKRGKKRRNKRDLYGIYEIPEYRSAKKRRKKKKLTIKRLLKDLIVIGAFFVMIYGVAFGVKYSMRDKAVSLYAKGDYEGAASLFEEALKPRLPLFENFDNDVRFYLADCYVNAGEYGNACCEYSQIKLWAYGRRIKGLDKLQEIVYALLLYDWKEYRSALPILLEAYESGYGNLVLYVGSCYGQTGDLENMQIYYDTFLQNNDMNSFMYAQYAAIALDEGRLDEALQYIETGRRLADQSNIKEILLDEIIYYEKQNDYNTAFEKAKAFVEVYPVDMRGRNEYDILYTRQNLTEQ